MKELVIAGLCLLGLLGLWIFGSYFEMETFNKFSSKKATLTDAMFAELRILADGK